MTDDHMTARPISQAFVTGGSGFVGRNLIAALRAKGVAVRALVRSASGALAVQRVGAEAIHGDLDDVTALTEGMHDCDVVFHVAAKTGDWGRKEDFYRANVTGTENILAAARAASVPCLVHVSTEAVLLGGKPIVQVDENRPLPAHPLGLYAQTKGLAEQAVLAANTPGVFETIIVRPRFIWGKDDTNILPQLIQMIQSGSFMWIDQGRYLTSTTHVDNVCEGLLLAAEYGRGGAIYFVTDGEPVEFRAFLTTMLSTQGVDPGERSLPRWLARTIAWWSEWTWRTFRLQGAPPLPRATVRVIGEEVTVSDARARRELGYQGLVTREAGLAGIKTIQTPSIPSEVR